MLIEKIIFNVLAFSLFVFMFFKMIKKNDTNYVIILCMQALGIAISFIEIIFSLKISICFKFVIYLMSVIIPIVIIYLEYKGINFSEIIYVTLAKIMLFTNNSKRAKDFLITLVTKYPESYLRT